MTQVLDHGSVELISSQATDLSVVAAARVSNGALYESASKGEDGDRRLIRYLLKHKHGTPFEHNVMTFFVTAPLFIAREWQRHRIGWSYNEVSGRYTELEEKFYVPEQLRKSDPNNKQGSAVAEWDAGLEQMLIGDIEMAAISAFDIYHGLLASGVAKEMARIILPLNTYTSFYATCNARSLMHFLDLRLAPGAQWEIQEYSRALELEFSKLMPITHEEWAAL